MSSSSATPRNVLFLLASARENGNAEQLARKAAESLPSGTVTDWLRLDAYQHEAFRDLRHAPGGYAARPASPEMLALAERTLAADELVIVAPVYWYSLPASAQSYLEHWSWWFRLPELRFRERMRGKVLSLVTTHSSDEDDGVAQPLLMSLQLSADYMEMGWRGALIGHGNQPGEVLQDPRAMANAREFLRRPVTVAKVEAA
ncbi:NAD(P)H-dependent oxidoreductase [Myxococcus sp. CA051A]|uniref:flavodoxin family protein n=1 Tax=unclassified Myxococcus TaxID=2648731 RepID=UPI00157B4E31|nr:MULTISPECIES: NAD(P)H-dependent oxidoreductase [unclassified Myxococcus]NTX09378.1 NAD(P)H-dependent oxidoreductase [Myxococcus sp. CA056]NTX50626.1 NAD(P)H-dependent oxidoreductase [Myxococcus sp. CA039A]NTX61204.1 NAD(P)H-dependent oxidoreductase [Myxococcus sp. CA051A]